MKFCKKCFVWKRRWLYILSAQETTTAQLRSHFCFPDYLVLILNEDRILSNYKKRDFAEILENFRSFSIFRPFTAAGHIATAF